MKTITAYLTVDNKIFTDEIVANAHELDLLGEELDDLLMHVFKLDVNRYNQHGALLRAMKNPKELKASIDKISNILDSITQQAKDDQE